MNLYKSVIVSAALLIADSGLVNAQSLAVKTNALYDITSSFSLGGEIICTPSTTLDVSCSYNPWTFSENKKMKHFMAQTEYRWWRTNVFDGEFYGLQLMFCNYNIGGSFPLGIDFGKRYQGYLYSIGASYGYQLPLSMHWNLEFAMSVGYVHSTYDSYGLKKEAAAIGSGNKNYLGITKLGISFVYIIK